VRRNEGVWAEEYSIRWRRRRAMFFGERDPKGRKEQEEELQMGNGGMKNVKEGGGE